MFWWAKKKKRIQGMDVDLVEERKVEGDYANSYVPSVFYGIYLHGKDTRVGNCDIRYGMNEELYYAGNIGYHIDPAYRGHGYAYDACLILFQLARKADMSELIITCSPDNIASEKTLEKLGGTILETTEVPHDHWLYRRGETVKNIHHYAL